jgi:hypothetical protein
LHQVPPSIQAPGFNFTAYLKSDHIRELDKSGLLSLEELHPDVTLLINAGKLVANRLDFVRGLELMLFGKESKQKLLERDQLHKVLAKETWMFGEEFHLSNNEETLNEVLTKFREGIVKPLDDDSPVTLEDGSTGRIDLMLARSVPHPWLNHLLRVPVYGTMLSS